MAHLVLGNLFLLVFGGGNTSTPMVARVSGVSDFPCSSVFRRGERRKPILGKGCSVIGVYLYKCNKNNNNNNNALKTFLRSLAYAHAFTLLNFVIGTTKKEQIAQTHTPQGLRVFPPTKNLSKLDNEKLA